MLGMLKSTVCVCITTPRHITGRLLKAVPVADLKCVLSVGGDITGNTTAISAGSFCDPLV